VLGSLKLQVDFSAMRCGHTQIRISAFYP